MNKKPIYKITNSQGTFLCDCEKKTLDAVVKNPGPHNVEIVYMTEQEYLANPATNESAAFFR